MVTIGTGQSQPDEQSIGYNDAGLLEALNVPIGSMYGWLKNLTGTPQTLPYGWMELNGQTISDSDSPYDGVTVPDANGNNLFQRGNSTSQGTGGESTHTLTIAEMPSHNHSYQRHDETNSADAGSDRAGDLTSANTSSVGSGNAHENKPPYLDVVWIFKYK